MTDRKAMQLIRRAERKRKGEKNILRWYSSVHPRRNGEADIKTWAVKTWKGKPLILLASVYPTDGGLPKVSGRCLVSMWDNCPHFNWLDYDGRSHVAVWEDVDYCRNEMLDPRNEHKFGRGIEFYGLGTFVNGFERTKYQYGRFCESDLRLSDWLDCMHISPRAELLIKAGLTRWLDPRYLPTLIDDKGLLNYVRARADRLRGISPYFVIRDYRKTGAIVNDERARAYLVCERYGFSNLAFGSLRILHWLERNGVDPKALRHHIDNLKELKMDLTYEPHVLPKDFAVYSLDIEERVHRRHEEIRLAKEAAQMEKERIAREARINARRTIRKWLAEGKIGPRFSIVIPNTETEMRTEGHVMSNCVGDYWHGHGWRTGECELAFIRKNGKPYIDVEIRDGRIFQARYHGNIEVPAVSKDYKVCEVALAAFRKAA